MLDDLAIPALVILALVILALAILALVVVAVRPFSFPSTHRLDRPPGSGRANCGEPRARYS
jgi:hypothetical protein